MAQRRGNIQLDLLAAAGNSTVDAALVRDERAELDAGDLSADRLEDIVGVGHLRDLDRMHEGTDLNNLETGIKL